MRLHLALLAASLSFPLLCLPAAAQTPDPATLSLAKELVNKTTGDRDQVLGSMGGPMVGMMQQMGIKDPTKAREMVNEAVMPILREHYEELVQIQATSYANALTQDDLKQTLAFYDTKAGQDLIKAQPALAQARVTGLTQWMATLQPEMQDRIAKMAKSHGWTNE